jgi:nicotinic acid mononucleotide adenylyltransferase
MRIIKPPPGAMRRLGLFPGGFNPPTRAHCALAEAALEHVDYLFWILPATYPHKAWEGATPAERERMLIAVTADRPQFGVAATEHGLFDDIASEVRDIYPDPDLYFVCGRDAAERVLTWDYGYPGAVDQMLGRWKLLVAPRGGPPSIAARHSAAVQLLRCAGYQEDSSTRVRGLLAAQADCGGLVHERILNLVREIYASPLLEQASRKARKR